MSDKIPPNRTPNNDENEMEELQAAPEFKEKTDFLSVPNDKQQKKNKVVMNENEELSKTIEGLQCVLPNNKNLFVAQKTSLILHFQKNEETEEILNFEKYAEKNRLYSMVMPKGSMIRKSYKKF